MAIDKSCPPHRRRVPRRALRVPKPEQIALDRVRARLQPIVTWRRAPAHAARSAEQRDTTSRPGSAWQRLDRRPIPTTRRPEQELRMHAPAAPPTPAGIRAARSLRTRTDARGTAGMRPSGAARAAQGETNRPPIRGWRSVRRAATVEDFIMWALPRGANERPEAADEDRAVTRSLSFCGRHAGGARGSHGGATAAWQRRQPDAIADPGPWPCGEPARAAEAAPPSPSRHLLRASAANRC